jgi:L-alanine-DL-glutamate epimerase-like enolase superfamily enzyme
VTRDGVSLHAGEDSDPAANPSGTTGSAPTAGAARTTGSVPATGAAPTTAAARTTGAIPTYACVARLPVAVERCELLPLVRDTSSGFTKVSIVVRLSGQGHDGEGEDITWDQIDQIEFLRSGHDLSWLRGTRTLDELSTLLDLANLFPVQPIRDSAHFYRRWAFESAALDLALRQSGLALHDAIGRPTRPVKFVASIRIGDPPSLHPLHALLSVHAELRFKLDPTPSWDDDLIAELARLGCVDVVDMKGLYRDVNVAMDPEAELYRRVLGGLPDAWIEDPAVAASTAALLERHRDRITWDEPIHSVANIESLPWTPRMLNIKPARFGSVKALFDTYDYCAAHDIGAYGGGMFEQGPGRGQLQYLASLFHPDAPNDVAPAGYNVQSPGDLPRSPLAPEPHATGFRWGTYDGRRTIRERISAEPA